MLFKLKCGVAFELLVRVAREHVNLNAFTVLLVSICVWVRWFSQEENKRKITKIAWLEMLIKGAADVFLEIVMQPFLGFDDIVPDSSSPATV